MPNPPMLCPGDRDAVALIPLAARTASGVGGAVILPREFRWVTFQLVVTAVERDGSQELHVWVQGSLDGVNWDDVTAFGEGASLIDAHVKSASLPAARADGAEQHIWTDGEAVAGFVAPFVLGRRFRVKWRITDGGGSHAAFTFQVVAYLR